MNRFLAFAMIGFAIAISAPVVAMETTPYSDAAFARAQAANKPILIEVHAPWCPVCAAQGRAMDRIMAKGGYDDLVVMRIDFDSQKSLWTKFGARKQSTLIAFRGKTETGRIAYVSDEASVAKLLASTVARH